jgi:hypothetical protein
MISKLTAAGVSGAADMGKSLVDTGLQALKQQTDMSAQQMENWSNSLFGSALSSGMSTMESFALSKIPGMPK